jgi:hypothetical protein
MATGLSDDPEHWRNRAHEARIRAGELNDPEAKRQMLGMREAMTALPSALRDECGRCRLPESPWDPGPLVS